jgi:hypothetical protein
MKVVQSDRSEFIFQEYIKMRISKHNHINFLSAEDLSNNQPYGANQETAAEI